MLIKLAYGKNGLTINMPDERTTVIEPTYVPGLPDEEGALRIAIRNPVGADPLRGIVGSDQTVAISVCDITRPMPSKTVLPVLLRELGHVPPDQVTIFIATGTHRANTPDEWDRMLGPEVASRYRIINHDAFDESTLVHVGDTANGIPIWLNREWVESDIRITTGFVEPHFFAGFSGGPKMVAPGLAGFETIMRLHNAEMIASPQATWGVTHGNPIHDAIREIASQTGVDFSIDVTINRDRKITSVFAGDLITAHDAASNAARRVAMQRVAEPFDIVVTTNSGFPLDLNLYQAVKGMSAAAQIVKNGGLIICAAECSDGIPDHGEYKELLSSASSPNELIEMIRAPGHNRHDQWQVQIQAQIQQRAEILLRTDYLSDQQVKAAHLRPVHDIESAVASSLEAFGPDARVCVLPQGPQTIPYLSHPEY